MYVLTIIHPPADGAAYGKAETIGPFAEKLKAVQRVTYIVAVKHDMPGTPAAAFAGTLRNEPDGTARTESMTGLTFRIDPTTNAPHPCPCCRRIVLPADLEGALCSGCYTFDNTEQCLPENTAHPADKEG